MYTLPSLQGGSLLGGAGIGAMPSLYSVGQQGISAGFDRLSQAMQEVTRLLHDSNEKRKDRKHQEKMQKKQQKEQKKMFGKKLAVGIGAGVVGGAIGGAILGPALAGAAVPAGAAASGAAGTAAGLSSVGAGTMIPAITANFAAMTAAPAITAGTGALIGAGLGGALGASNAIGGGDAGIPTPAQAFSAMGQAQRVSAPGAGVSAMDIPLGGGATMGQLFPGAANMPEGFGEQLATPRRVQYFQMTQPRGSASSAAPQVPGLAERISASSDPSDMMSTVYQYYMENPNTPIGPGLSAMEAVHQFPGYEGAPFPFKYDETAGGWPRVKGGMERQVNPDFWKWQQEEKKRRMLQFGAPWPGQ